ncbi:1278_t:CDS:2, partial [Funneliformis geosporum]
WIDKKENLHYEKKRIPYKFDLLYRASRDGNTPAAFHQKCDNKGATIVIVKLTNSEQIIGGYNPIGWEGNNDYKSTDDSFIFSFVNRTNLQTAKGSETKFGSCMES